MLKLNVNRTFPAAVTVHLIDEEGQSQKGEFNAVFKVLSSEQAADEANSDKRLLDLVLVSVSDIELTGADGKVLEGEVLLNAVKGDPALSTALIATYNESLTKKNLRRT